MKRPRQKLLVRRVSILEVNFSLTNRTVLIEEICYNWYHSI